MQSTSVRKHNNGATHQANLKAWVAKQEAKRRPTSFINHDQSCIHSDPASHDDEAHAEHVDLGCNQNEPTESFIRDRLIGLWTKNHSMIFASPAVSVHSGQDEPIGNPMEHDKSEFGDDESENSNDEDADSINEIDDSWYPFTSLEVCPTIYI